MEMRKCSLCKKKLIMDNFSINPKTGDLYKCCDSCRERAKVYYENIPKTKKEEYNKNNKLYKEANKEKLLNSKKVYREKNRDKISEYNKSYYNKVTKIKYKDKVNKDKVSEYQKLYF